MNPLRGDNLLGFTCKTQGIYSHLHYASKLVESVMNPDKKEKMAQENSYSYSFTVKTVHAE
jgi:hypothetical protein